jgi:hypothetical protein
MSSTLAANTDVTENDVHEALKILIKIEKDTTDAEEGVYESEIEKNAVQIAKSEEILKRYAKQNEGELSDMQDAYYKITTAPRYRNDMIAMSVACSALNDAFNGVGVWQR